MSPQSLDILFLAYSLDVGGTERQLVNLAKGLHERGHKARIALFYGDGALEPEAVMAGIPVTHLEKKSRWDFLGLLWRFTRLVRANKPSVVYSFLSTPNILAGMLKLIIPRVRVVWGVRSSHVDYSRYDALFRYADRVERVMSSLPDLIICNSQAGMTHVVDKGFPAGKTTIISNGIDTDKFNTDMAARRQVRAEWGIDDKEFLIGLVGRLDPMKDHTTFIKSAGLLAREVKDVRFVCVGGGDPDRMRELVQMTRASEIEDRLIWAGHRSDMPSVYSALDLLCLSSSGEGFPNVIGEAMACGVPCVATDVGDAALIIGRHGVIVKPDDQVALVDGLRDMIQRGRDKLIDRQAVRHRIVQHFGIQKMHESTERAISLLLHPLTA